MKDADVPLTPQMTAAPLRRAAEDATPCPEAEAEKLAAEAAFRSLDRHVHAHLGTAVGGLSVIGLAQAWADWAAHLAISPGKQMELVWKGWRKWHRLNTALWSGLTGHDPDDACIEPLPQDRRFSAPQWQRMPYRAIWQSFLLTQQWWHNATTGIPGVSRDNERLVEFYSRQFLDMLSPSNFLATNPQLMDRTVKEGGQNLIRGLAAWAEDAARALTGDATPRPLDFLPGRDVALTPGKVVYRNALMELIQYAPTTPTVQAVPILIVPAWIMKYYILDLSPENSLIRWLVAQGFTVFCISWKNPEAEDRDFGFDDYRTLGVMAALDIACAITGAPRVHGLGYCLGGTLLSVTAAAMARDGDDRLASLSLLAAQVDFSEAGELSMFTSEPQIALIEDMMWEDGYLDQRRMAGAFNMLRSQDLIWSRITRAYLMGERDHPTDLGSWSADATRMPYRMHSDYLRRLFLRNDLSAGRFTAGGQPVYLADIRVPIFAVATEHDHIAPWKSVYKLTHLVHGALNFALVSGGHNTGIVAPPGNPKAHFRLLEHRPESNHRDPEVWAREHPATPGSWWQAWCDWLVPQSGGQVAPPQMGKPDTGGKGLGKAPGRYVLAR
ncbi:alpha/beta fold hydrolase [Phaeovulum sp. NW3]|uniref:PHA/PHB synthase family protein n=1 Tax=Phaeovulum sp. NW3 TaxID=2934933 RepID=UPI002020EEFA|nr:alpha/beta fold hydrolase [Phaeovulum sp. NW3]MCL7464297.1 alpha/beta fold hydrolase [Phaeovulum sp. NW3]